MKLQSTLLRNSLLFLAVILAWPALRAAAQTPSKPDSSASFAQTPAVPARITQAIDETQLVRLKGNVHPLARPEFDQGIVADATPMSRMLLLLQRSPEQQAALSQLMDDQLSKDSPNFHKWLTPQQFGAQFGPADADIQTVTQWLGSHGFHDIKVGAGRTTIEFSGNVGQVRNAFHTEIHGYSVKGEARQANTADPQIPAALTPVVAGIVSLHNFPRKSMKHDAGTFTRTAEGVVKPLFTTTSGCGPSGTSPCYVLGPADFAKVYNIPAALDGTGVTIAIVGDSNINPQDVIDFRALFGLPANFTAANIILNGPDPGLGGSEGEADLDVQTSGMVAPKATINLVASETTLTASGIDLSALYIIDNNIAPVMSESFGSCEVGLTTAGNQFYNGLWEQAAAQGITAMVSAGDNGSAGCDDFTTQSTATGGLAVSGIASTPFNVAVGGTDFDDVGTQTNFWSPSSGNAAGTRESALGYIPETTWNDSCAATATSTTLNTVCASPTNIVAGSGGPSSVYTKPAWQSGIIPNGIAAGDNHRYIPDVSLFASDGFHSNSFYLFCEADAIQPGSPTSCASSGSFSFEGAGGTSASSPAFAGIMALINQKMGGRQGNANPVLYKIAATSGQSCPSSTTPLTGSATCSFYDVTKGNNSVPCVANSPAGTSPNCSSTTVGTTGVLVSTGSTTTPGWTTATGYDLATGLGSVNVTNLSTQWPLAVGAFKSTTTSLALNGGTSTVTISHGTGVTAKVTVTSGSGTPTGDVALLAPTAVNGGIGEATLSGGSATATGVILPGGSYNVNARYAGDTTFASSTSATGVPVVVSKEASHLQYGIVTFDSLGNIISTNATSVAYGSAYILRIDILNSTGTVTNCQPLTTGVTTGCAFDATGTVTFTDSATGTPPGTAAGTFTINSAGHAENQPIQLTGGVHNLSATYSGDISYNAVTTAVTDSVTVSPTATATSLAASPTTGVTTATPVVLTATISSASNSATGTTGTVTFFNGGTQIGSPVAVTPIGASTVGAGGAAALTTTFTTAGTKSITATYNGDTNYTTSAASAIMVTVTQAQTGSFTVSYNPNPVILSSSTGANVMSAVTVTPTGGFTGMVTVTCPTGASLPPGVTCTAPAAINITNANPVQANLTLSVTATSTTLTASATPAERNIYAAGLAPSGLGKGWWGLSAVTGLGALILLLLPGRKRYRAALGLGLVCMLSFTLGCGGGYGGGNKGPVATMTHISVPAPGRVASPNTFTFTATVTGGTPTDQVQLFDSGAPVGTAVAVSGGTATLTSPALSVGTHSISAHYLGDATYTLASQSGSLNVTVTGNTSVAITTSPTATPAAPVLNVTVN
jgi:subtilase family serine protease